MIEHNVMDAIHGIIVHQTGGSTAASALSSYLNKGANGAHLLVDKDGTVYQTASFLRQTWHVGKLRSRCLAEHRCSPKEIKELTRFNPKAENQREAKKVVPDRYPSNTDAIGIELVGRSDAHDLYEPVTAAQNRALAWLVAEIRDTYCIMLSEVFRHPTVSRKTESEASTARWE